MTLLYFVTPAFRRYELTAVCLDQRLEVIRELGKHGIEARCVVVADDENLDIARERGMDVVERDNEYLGRRFNDGMEFAGRQGADWIVPIGSDSWIDPAYFLPLPPPRTTRTSRRYAPVAADRMAETVVRSRAGAGPYVFHRRLLEPSGFRPADEHKRSGVDRSTVAGIGRTRIHWRRRDMHPFQYVGFRHPEHFITAYDVLLQRWGIREHRDPWAILARHYPPALVARAREAITA